LTDLLIGLTDEVIGVQSQLVATAELFAARREAIEREITGRVRLALIGDEYIGQRPIKQFAIEVVLGLLQSAVFDRGDGDGLIHFSFVRTRRARTSDFASHWLAPELRVRKGEEGR
jgi:hypothetical protein